MHWSYLILTVGVGDLGVCIGGKQQMEGHRCIRYVLPVCIVLGDGHLLVDDVNETQPVIGQVDLQRGTDSQSQTT